MKLYTIDHHSLANKCGTHTSATSFMVITSITQIPSHMLHYIRILD